MSNPSRNERAKVYKGESGKELYVPTRRPTTARVLALVADAYGMTPESLLEQTHRAAIVEPRQVAMWLLREVAGMSYPRIGRALGGKHHTTVMYAVRRVARRMGEEQEFGEMVARLLEGAR